MAQTDWLIARPLAHRGLHDGKTIIENTPSAFAAAIAGEYGIECDLQISSDGEAMVYHDDALGRVIEGNARIDAMTAAQLKQVPFRASSDRMITLGDLCDLTAGRSTLLIELKSHYDSDRRLAARAAAVLSHYDGPVAVMSFDPAQMGAFRHEAPVILRGLVAERRGRYSGRSLGAALRHGARVLSMRPQFIAYSVKDLPTTVTSAARKLLHLPLLTWTVRTATEHKTAQHYADQIIFEGFRP